jgi:hypothetical protein
MKIVISESQYNRLIEAEEKPKILKFPSLEFFDEDRKVAWNIIQKILERKGNPPYSIEGDLDLQYSPIESLGNLQFVGGYLSLQDTSIESLGNLKSVGGYLNLAYTSIESLGNLQSVGGDLYLHGTPLSIYTREQIREMVNVEGRIFK